MSPPPRTRDTGQWSAAFPAQTGEKREGKEGERVRLKQQRGRDKGMEGGGGGARGGEGLWVGRWRMNMGRTRERDREGLFVGWLLNVPATG